MAFHIKQFEAMNEGLRFTAADPKTISKIGCIYLRFHSAHTATSIKQFIGHKC